MMWDCPPGIPRVERERITTPGVPGEVLGDWILEYHGRTWAFQSWAAALEFVAMEGHLHPPRRAA